MVVFSKPPKQEGAGRSDNRLTNTSGGTLGDRNLEYTVKILAAYRDELHIPIVEELFTHLRKHPLPLDPNGRISGELRRRLRRSRSAGSLQTIFRQPLVPSTLFAAIAQVLAATQKIPLNGGPNLEESHLVIVHPDQLYYADQSNDWCGLWRGALKHPTVLPHVLCYLEDKPIIIGYATTVRSNQQIDVQLYYRGPGQIQAYIEGIFAQLMPALRTYENQMANFEQREGYQSLIFGISRAIPYMIIGILLDVLTRLFLDPTGVVYRGVRKIIEIPIRWMQGNADTVAQYIYLRRRATEESNLSKSLYSVRVSLWISAIGVITMLGLPLLQIDVTSPWYFIAVTLAASADNAAQAIMKAIANYRTATQKNLVEASIKDPWVVGNLLGTSVIALIDIGIRLGAHLTGIRHLLGYIVAIASESGLLGNLDSEIAALYMGNNRRHLIKTTWGSVFTPGNLDKVVKQVHLVSFL